MQLEPDPITHRLRVVAPGRDARLTHVANTCPFCPGAEDQTPSALDHVERRAHLDDEVAGDWSARTFANRFPLTRGHEVLVPTPRHAVRWSDLTLPELSAGLELLLRRGRLLRASDSYVHAFINDGVAAGASMPHVHAQLVPMPRSEPVEHLTRGVRDDACWLCAVADGAHEELLVEQGPHVQLLAHPMPRLGGGLLIAPRTHDVDVATSMVEEVAALLHRALQVTKDAPGCNAWLVVDPTVAAHWYLEVQPRSTNLAGVELALGVTVVSRSAADTACDARERLGMAKRSPRPTSA